MQVVIAFVFLLHPYRIAIAASALPVYITGVQILALVTTGDGIFPSTNVNLLRTLTLVNLDLETAGFQCMIDTESVYTVLWLVRMLTPFWISFIAILVGVIVWLLRLCWHAVAGLGRKVKQEGTQTCCLC
jgi:hypothetical protein